MTSITKLMCGIILLTLPTIQYGGFFLLKVLSGNEGASLTAFQKSMFRAGHAHAGVLVILSLIAQVLTDQTNLSPILEWTVRIGFPLAAILVSGGFFASAIGNNLNTPNRLIWILYSGIITLGIAIIVLGVGLIANK